MPVYTLHRQQRISLPIADCWQFFSDPRNLQKITPPEMRFRIHSDLPAQIYPGLMIHYTVSPLLGIPLTWVTEITQVRAPEYFADEQRIGPYRMWHHEHTFRSITQNETETTDLVHYAPPLGSIGAILNKLLIRRQLEHVFDYRTAQLTKIAHLNSIH